MKRKNLLFASAILLIIGMVFAGLFTGISQRMTRTAIPVHLNPERPVVAFTFDDGPNPQYTPAVLDVLYEEQVPGTFFLVGEKLDGNQLLIQEMAQSGHEIGNHTFSHPDLTTLHPNQVTSEIRKTEEALREILPDYQIHFVRPPYGHYTEWVEQAVPLPLMLWTIDSNDWETPDAQQIAATVLAEIADGDIVVFHDDNPETVLALQTIIPTLKARGFQFATVSQLCHQPG